MNFIYVAIGGVLGSCLRAYVAGKITRKMNNIYPLAIFIINCIGSFLLGFVQIYSTYGIYILIADGFLGAFTTFSTFMLEGVNILKEYKFKKGIVYFMVSMFCGICIFIIGYKLGLFLDYSKT